MAEALTSLNQLTAEQQRTIQHAIDHDSSKPLSVAIMGQTGVGKSSLLNALFGAGLTVGDARPTTKVPEPIHVHGSSGHPITFWDMPGIGESVDADESYLSLYRTKLLESDVVIWAMHSDSRSTLTDSQALQHLLADTPPTERSKLFAKITFVLTKADILTPPPWIYFRDGEAGKFSPGPQTRRRLDEKCEYYQEVLIDPYGGLHATWTHSSHNFALDDPRFEYDDVSVEFQGHMSGEVFQEYRSRYPNFAPVFERLRDNQRVIPCSALFRYNLLRLMVVIVNKLGDSAIGRFQRLVSTRTFLEEVPIGAMRSYGNLVVWDKRRGEVTFDLEEFDLEGGS